MYESSREYEMFLRAMETSAKMSFKALEWGLREAKAWAADVEKRCASQAISEERAYHDQMELDNKILDIYVQKAEEKGLISHDDVLDLKARVEELKGARGLSDSRQASFELRDILNQYKHADLDVKKGVAPKTAYRDIGKAPAIAKERAKVFFKGIEQSLKRMQDQLRDTVAQRCR